MFVKYEHLDSSSDPSQIPRRHYDILLIDEDFEENIKAYQTTNGLDIITPIAIVYERRGLNVAANLAKCYMHFCERFNWDRKTSWDRLTKANATFAKYREDIEKYLLLI